MKATHSSPFIPTVDVLIVGAGPVGLFLANECARRGLSFRIAEQRPTQSTYSKALAIFPRTLEILDMAGLAGPFLQAANPVTAVAIVTHGRELARMRFAPEESPYPMIAMVPQNVTERLLVDALKRRGGAVEYETTFVSAREEDDAVRAILEHDGRREELRARFVVGCDGAHSAVRHLLGLRFDGAAYDSLFMLADVETNDALPANELQLCPSEFGPLAIFPMSATRRRIVATVEGADGEAPSLELVQALLRQRGPGRIEARAINWSSFFRVHHRQVAEMSVGRMFVAGDAAHIHSPYGGQGMNTGLHDVWNLAWKLDLVARDRGGEQLLDSYTIERRPVVKHVIATTDFLTKAMGTPNRLAQVLRDAVIPMVSRLAPFQHAFVQRLSELGVAYAGSPIVEGAGERYLDDSMRGGNGIGNRFLLFVGGRVDPVVDRQATELAVAMPDIVEVRRTMNDAVVLVRPDGYTAYSADAPVSPGVIGDIQTLLERQTTMDAGTVSVAAARTR